MTFAGGVLVVAVLYWAQAVLVPFALAILLTFVLTPPVTWLQRWVGRVPAVLLVVTLVFAALGLVGWGLTWQMDHLVDDLPGYRANIRTKIADVRLAGRGSAVEKLQEMLEGIKADLETSEAPKGTVTRPLVVASNQADRFFGLRVARARRRAAEHGGARRGDGHLHAARTPRSAGSPDRADRARTARHDHEGIRRGRKSRQPAAVDAVACESAVTASRSSSDCTSSTSLTHWSGPRWVLRFDSSRTSVPCSRPVRRSSSVSRRCEGWTGPLFVLALFIVLELFTNLVLETVLYAGAVGVSQVVLLVSVAFWTWLWGPLGLLMASPLTVCLVVLGKHVPGLAFVGMLMDDTPALAPEYGYYQRLLARDQSEAAELIDSHIKTETPASVYDALLLPALCYAERDRLEHRLSSEEEAAVIDATRELISDAAETIRRTRGDGATRRGLPIPRSWDRASRCAHWATQSTGAPIEVALAMLAHLLDDLPIAMEITGTRMQAAELVSLVEDRKFSVVLFADLPPSSSSKTRYLVRRLRSALPELRIAVGRWGPPALADESSQTLLDAGANHVASLLIESREYLGGLVEVPRLPGPDTPGAAGPTAPPPSLGRGSC